MPAEVHVFYFYIGFICLLILNVMTGAALPKKDKTDFGMKP